MPSSDVGIYENWKTYYFLGSLSLESEGANQVKSDFNPLCYCPKYVVLEA